MNRSRASRLTMVLRLAVGPCFVVCMAALFSMTSVYAQKAPDALEGLQLWLDADDLGLSDGDEVDIWYDLSGNDRSAVAMEGGVAHSYVPRFPTFKENPENVLNGLPVVHFDGTIGNPEEDPNPERGAAITYLDAEGGEFGYDDLTSGGLTYVMVASVDNKLIEDAGLYAPDAGWNVVFAVPHKAGVGDRVQIQRRTSGGTPSYSRYDALDLSEYSIVAASITDLQPDVEATRSSYWNSAVPGHSVVGMNNGQDLEGPPLGFWAQHGQYDIAELLIYDRALSGGEIGDVGFGLAQKYGIDAFAVLPTRYNSSEDPEVVSEEAIQFTGNGENLSMSDAEGGYWNMSVTRASRYQASPEIGQVFTLTAYGHVNEVVSGNRITGLGIIAEPEADNSVRISFVGNTGDPDPQDLMQIVDPTSIVEGVPQRAFDLDATVDHIYQIIRAEGNNFEAYVDGEKAFDLTPSESIGLDNFTGWSISTASSSTTVSDSSWRLIEMRRDVHIYKPGDADFDGDVDFTDFSVLAGNFTGTLAPFEGDTEWSEGDFNFDGAVDFADFSNLAGNFTGTITAPASDAASDGDVHLSIDLTNNGAMTLEANNADLAGYSIRSPDSQLVPDADGAAAPFMFYLLNAAQEVTAGSVGATTALAADLALDISFAGDAAQAANVVFQYTRAGDVTPVDGVVHVIPEPASMILLAAGGLLVMSRRRRSA